MSNLSEYQKIVGSKVINQIYRKAKKLQKKHIVCISSTYQGGGVAEILNSLVFLFNELGIKFGWRIIYGSPDFFAITKSFHNALQGEKVSFTKKDRELYENINRRFSVLSHLDHDLVIVHDPQPLALIDFYKKKQPWIFRCHIDITNPNKKIWDYLKKYINNYDHFVVSSEEYYKKDLSIPESIIHPAIDPLTPKHLPMTKKRAMSYFKKYKIRHDIPIISQISRYDKWKDFDGAIEVFKKVKKEINCQMVVLGNVASDDAEGLEVYEDLRLRYEKEDGLIILANVDDNDLFVNALQRYSDVIIQKSLKEGFALTVAEALYKGTPVVASNVGGIPLQVFDGYNGYLHKPNDIDGFADSVVKILSDDSLRKRLGDNGHEYVVKNFLITRLALDWLDLFEKYLP